MEERHHLQQSRFLLIKTCSDLILLKSNLYSEENGFLTINKK